MQVQGFFNYMTNYVSEQFNRIRNSQFITIRNLIICWSPIPKKIDLSRISLCYSIVLVETSKPWSYVHPQSGPCYHLGMDSQNQSAI